MRDKIAALCLIVAIGIFVALSVQKDNLERELAVCSIRLKQQRSFHPLPCSYEWEVMNYRQRIFGLWDERNKAIADLFDCINNRENRAELLPCPHEYRALQLEKRMVTMYETQTRQSGTIARLLTDCPPDSLKARLKP